MRSWRGLTAGVLAVAGVLATASPALAHEKWFSESAEYPLRWDLFVQPLPLALFGAVLLATLAAGLLWWRARGRGFLPGLKSFGATDERRAMIFSLVPLILGIHVAVPLLVNGVQGNLFSPDNALPGVWANFLGLAETFVALALFYGAFTRLAAAGLAGLWVAGLFLVGPQPMLDNTLYLGFAAFFLLAGRGPISIDRLLLPRLEPPEHLMRYAMTALRVGLGLSFVIVAFTEKFANLPLSRSFLERYPLNFTSALGIPLPDDVFILFAGAVELLVGLWILSGIFPREIALIALIPVNLTLTIFNWSELIGHLPIYGILAVMLLWEPGRENLALWLRGLREGPLSIRPVTSEGDPGEAGNRDGASVGRQEPTKTL